MERGAAILLLYINVVTKIFKIVGKGAGTGTETWSYLYTEASWQQCHYCTNHVKLAFKNKTMKGA